jgi:hypothetical protein
VRLGPATICPMRLTLVHFDAEQLRLTGHPPPPRRRGAGGGGGPEAQSLTLCHSSSSSSSSRRRREQAAMASVARMPSAPDHRYAWRRKKTSAPRWQKPHAQLALAIAPMRAAQSVGACRAAAVSLVRRRRARRDRSTPPPPWSGRPSERGEQAC